MNHPISDEELYQQAVQRDNPFMRHNYIEIELVEMDRAVLRLDIREESRNPYGQIHGGILCAMADNATAIAAHTDGGTYVTQNCSIYFLGNQKDGIIRAEARVHHRGRTVVFVDVDVTGESGKPLLSGQYCLFSKGAGNH